MRCCIWILEEEAGQWTANLYSSNENLQALEFLKHLNSIVKKQYPGILLIAQEDGLWPQLTDSVENDHPGLIINGVADGPEIS